MSRRGLQCRDERSSTTTATTGAPRHCRAAATISAQLRAVDEVSSLELRRAASSRARHHRRGAAAAFVRACATPSAGTSQAAGLLGPVGLGRPPGCLSYVFVN